LEFKIIIANLNTSFHRTHGRAEIEYIRTGWHAAHVALSNYSQSGIIINYQHLLDYLLPLRNAIFYGFTFAATFIANKAAVREVGLIKLKVDLLLRNGVEAEYISNV
jgi:hypothetical protein